MDKSIITFMKRAFRNNNTLKSKMAPVSFIIAVFFVFGFFSVFIDYLNIWSFENDYKSRIVLVNAPEEFTDFLLERYMAANPEATRVQAVTKIIANYPQTTLDAPYDFISFSNLMKKYDAGFLIYFPEDFSIEENNTNEILLYYRTNSLKYGTDKESIETLLTSDFNSYLVEKADRLNLSTNPTSIRHTEIPVQIISSFAYPVAMILPLLVFIFALYTAMSGGTNIIAGEKERGTFAAIILSPVKRSSIIFGDFLGVFFLALIPSFLITFPAMIILFIDNASVYIAAFLLVISFVAFITALALLVSVLNPTTVAAQTAFLPIFLVLLVTAISCIQNLGSSEKYYNYFPIYGHFYGLGNALTYKIVPGGISSSTPLIDSIICSLITLAITALILVICTKLLYKEKYITISEGITLKDIRRAKNPRKEFPLGTLIDQAVYPMFVLSLIQFIALIPTTIIYMRDGSFSDFILSLKDVTTLPEILEVTSEILALFLSNKVFLITMAIGYLVLILIYALRIRIREGNVKPLESMGIYKKNAFSWYLKGLVLGFVLLSFVCMFLLVTGCLKFTGIAVTLNTLPTILVSIPMWIFQGAAEEVMFRGFMIPRIKNKTNLVFAVLYSSFLFAILHGANIGFTLLAGINLFLIAIFFALVYLYTNNLLITCAMHTAWNFCQGTLYGLEVSGSTSSISILASKYMEGAPDVLTGGAFGPEGGLGVTIISIIGIIITLTLYRKKLAHQAK